MKSSIMADIKQKIEDARKAKQRNYDEALRLLEDAHLLAQPMAWAHTKVHWQMLLLAIEYKNLKELLGQIARLFLAAPGSLLGKAPKGNVGSTRMGIFEERE